MNVSNSWSIVSVMPCFLQVEHTPIPLQTQFIGPTFRSSSQDDVRCSTASICLWLSHSYINNAIKSLIVLKIVMFLMDGMHRCGTIVLCLRYSQGVVLRSNQEMELRLWLCAPISILIKLSENYADPSGHSSTRSGSDSI